MYGKFPKKISDLPSEEFYAILTPESATIPGDERSRTNPGHGYPEHSVDSWGMETFNTKEEWEDEIKNRLTKTYSNKNFKAVKIVPANIKTELKIQIE